MVNPVSPQKPVVFLNLQGPGGEEVIENGS